MDKIQRLERLLKQLRSVYGLRTSVPRNYSTDKDSTEKSTPDSNIEIAETPKLGGFATAFEKFSDIEEPKKEEKPATFASLLRNSKLIDLGDPEGKLVSGKIFHVVGDNLYIDFGWKFHCVCNRPKKNAKLYVRGSMVRLKIKDLELSTRFLGATRDLTVLEADCVLLGLISSPVPKQSASV